ncbi:MAG: helix-turn-helix domain-containing protein [Bacteroidota bacterium]|nr:helix-turn-helix domain-containing protein [Bacteroidota bacterium]
METIAWIGFSQGFFAAILMLSKKGLNVSDKILAAWLCLLAYEFMRCAMDYRVYGTPLLSSSFLLFNPAFYLYSRTLVGGTFKLKPVQLMHLFPFLFFDGCAYLLHETYRLQSFMVPDEHLWFRVAFSLASVISWGVYNWATGQLLLRHRKRLADEFSTIESNKRVSWLVFVVVSYNLFCLSGIAVALLVILLKLEFPLSPVYTYSAMLLMAYVLSFYGLRQQTIVMEVVPEEEVKEKYQNSYLSDQRKSEIQALLKAYFDRTCPYLNPELNMTRLSEALQVPKHQLTEVLSTVFSKNFFQFVNEYRVEAVKNRLSSEKNYSIEAIGYECGFNSKSSFFTVFKQLTGMTPLQFKKQLEE